MIMRMKEMKGNPALWKGGAGSPTPQPYLPSQVQKSGQIGLNHCSNPEGDIFEKGNASNVQLVGKLGKVEGPEKLQKGTAVLTQPHCEFETQNSRKHAETAEPTEEGLSISLGSPTQGERLCE